MMVEVSLNFLIFGALLLGLVVGHHCLMAFITYGDE